MLDQMQKVIKTFGGKGKKRRMLFPGLGGKGF
jgi:hypothetical protein